MKTILITGAGGYIGSVANINKVYYHYIHIDEN